MPVERGVDFQEAILDARIKVGADAVEALAEREDTLLVEADREVPLAGPAAARSGPVSTSASARATPDFCGSSPVLTSTINSGVRPSFWMAAAMASRCSYSTESIVLLPTISRTADSAACTTALLSTDAAVRAVRERIGAEIHKRVKSALGPDAEARTVAALEMSYFGALVQAGSGAFTYRQIADRLEYVAGLVLGDPGGDR